MEYLTTDKEGIKILIEVLKEKGIRQVVLSPGSRNAPLLVAFAREKQIRHFVVLDERSAAFMALGMAQQSGCSGGFGMHVGDCSFELCTGDSGSILPTFTLDRDHGRPSGGMDRSGR